MHQAMQESTEPQRILTPSEWRVVKIALAFVVAIFSGLLTWLTIWQIIFWPVSPGIREVIFLSLPIFLYSSGYILYSLSVLSRLPEPVSTFYPARAKRWLLRYYAGVGILILAIWVVGLLYFITAAGIKFFSP
jgi:hypothetical protein